MTIKNRYGERCLSCGSRLDVNMIIGEADDGRYIIVCPSCLVRQYVEIHSSINTKERLGSTNRPSPK